jgi:hypothetical protein
MLLITCLKPSSSSSPQDSACTMLSSSANSTIPTPTSCATSAKPLSYTDPGNLAFRWCSITAPGKFDFLRGGQIILWDLGLVIDFPPGSIILILSAVIRHSNTTIEASETCYSFTQYAAGGLFHWVRNGFCLDKKNCSKGDEGADGAEGGRSPEGLEGWLEPFLEAL